MTRFIFLLLALNIFVFAKAENDIHSAKKNTVPIIYLKGSAYERGFQHGSQMKKEIQEVYTKWKKSVAEDTGKDANFVINDFITSSNYMEAIEKWTPDLLEEIKGLAAGSQQSFNDVLAFQLIDEYWGYLDRLKNNSTNKEHCSAIGVAKTKNQPTMIAENIDIDNFLHGYQLMLHIEKSKNTPEQLVMTAVGYLGFAGMNKKLSVVINALTDLNNSVSGLPVIFVTRGLLQHTSEEKALNFLKNIKHATGQNYLIGTKNNVYTFEASANRIDEFQPYNNNQLVYHTNHSIINPDIKPWIEEYREKVVIPSGKKTNSQTRLSSLESQIIGAKEIVTFTTIKDILSSKQDPIFPICVSYKEGGSAFTFSSVIFTLGKNPNAAVTYGSPDQSDYQKFHFK